MFNLIKIAAVAIFALSSFTANAQTTTRIYSSADTSSCSNTGANVVCAYRDLCRNLNSSVDSATDGLDCSGSKSFNRFVEFGNPTECPTTTNRTMAGGCPAGTTKAVTARTSNLGALPAANYYDVYYQCLLADTSGTSTSSAGGSTACIYFVNRSTSSGPALSSPRLIYGSPNWACRDHSSSGNVSIASICPSGSSPYTGVNGITTPSGELFCMVN